jgi:hypothetical protein
MPSMPEDTPVDPSGFRFQSFLLWVEPLGQRLVACRCCRHDLIDAPCMRRMHAVYEVLDSTGPAMVLRLPSMRKRPRLEGDFCRSMLAEDHNKYYRHTPVSLDPVTRLSWMTVRHMAAHTRTSSSRTKRSKSGSPKIDRVSPSFTAPT